MPVVAQVQPNEIGNCPVVLDDQDARHRYSSPSDGSPTRYASIFGNSGASGTTAVNAWEPHSPRLVQSPSEAGGRPSWARIRFAVVGRKGEIEMAIRRVASAADQRTVSSV